jgi:serine/threonine-protein kinase
LIEWKNAEWLSILAAAHAEAGNFDEAVKWQAKCVEQATPQAREELQARLKTYQDTRAFRDHIAPAP